ncbi:stage V sporulation protein D [Thermobrachium celere]|uniref:Cell division protein FtsI [Peptidoglycan synthetase] n=1 Tax=Thermobrachium celere DSM 8682 TaxID=941824 RepID=R7RR43_9CLOT|nr:stage V sporulation protein D [Thermobrachium celere]CDF57826.1 Cell division protein FtsI [Peptidoglycan synthetase] [Thermobrachium celere DSM 8682]
MSKTTLSMKRRIAVVYAIIILVQTVIVGRYAWVQLVWSPQLQRMAQEQWTNNVVIEAKRGKILDRNGNPLALSGNVDRIDVFLKDVINAEKNNKVTKDEIASKLAPLLGMSKEDILKKLNMKYNAVTIKRRVEKDIGNKVRELKLPGVIVSEDTKRYYPNGNFLAHILGSTDSDGNGRSGLELYYNKELKGIPGRLVVQADAYHRELPYESAVYDPPRNGYDLVLTIDQSIQFFVERALEQGLKEYNAKRISAIVMDPKTGEILAMANKPDFDPNNPVGGLDIQEALANWRNRMVQEVFEPGSILKVVTAAAALEENIVSDNDKFVCTGGKMVAGRRIKCWRTSGHGTQTFAEILQNSCNVGFMELGLELGAEKLHKYFALFGFGQKTGIDFPGEEKGLLTPVSKMGPVETANQAFGQGVAVTGIQYLTALAAIANDGVMMRPHLLKQVIYTDENGNTSVIKEYMPQSVKQVVSKETAIKLREILESVVTKGAAKKAYLEGYHVGGKTGTAQKPKEEGKGYAAGKYISSFAAIAPANNPKIAILVSIDEPDPSNYYAGSTAAPLAKIIIEDIMKYLNVEPDSTAVQVPEVVVPEVRGLKLDEAINILKQYKFEAEKQGSGDIVYDMSPKPGVSAKQNTKVILYMGYEQNKNAKVIVPDFKNLTKKEIQDLAKSIGLKVNISGEGIGATQDILPGQEVDKNTTINVLLEQPED